MLIRPVSDLHFEFSSKFELEPLKEDKDTVLILAGDICNIDRATDITIMRSFMETWSEQFKYVLWVFGNHEFYKHKLNCAHAKALEITCSFDNVEILENETAIIDDVVFLGTTLWTDYQRENPLVMNEAQRIMNDYKQIRLGPSDFDIKHNKPGSYRKIRPEDLLLRHKIAKKFLETEIPKTWDDGFRKHVVITHQAPSWQSIAQEHLSSSLNGCYASDLDQMIMDLRPQLWIHGHVHQNFDYNIEDTRIICNPRGYVPEEPNRQFNPNLVVDI